MKYVYPMEFVCLTCSGDLEKAKAVMGFNLVINVCSGGRVVLGRFTPTSLRIFPFLIDNLSFEVC
jgi:hypothetical protein